MGKHTQGPWENGKKIPLRATSLEQVGIDLVFANYHHPEADANARLISQAPAMLEALKDAESHLEMYLRDCEEWDAKIEERDSLPADYRSAVTENVERDLNAIRAVIRAATVEERG